MAAGPALRWQEFAVVVGDEHHFLRRHLGYSYSADLIGKSGYYEDVVALPPLVEVTHCVPYHFVFRSLRNEMPQRLPEVVRHDGARRARATWAAY